MNLTQAYEVFFISFLKVKLIYEPFASAGNPDDINDLLRLLYTTLEDCSFYHLRNIFLRVIIDNIRVDNIAEAKNHISLLKNKTAEPADKNLDVIKDLELKKRLRILKRSTINRLRNDIAHKNAYRPSIQEVNSSIEETREVIFFLATKFGIYGVGKNFYI